MGYYRALLRSYYIAGDRHGGLGINHIALTQAAKRRTIAARSDSCGNKAQVD
jgi:hypothetical protein